MKVSKGGVTLDRIDEMFIDELEEWVEDAREVETEINKKG